MTRWKYRGRSERMGMSEATWVAEASTAVEWATPRPRNSHTLTVSRLLAGMLWAWSATVPSVFWYLRVTGTGAGLGLDKRMNSSKSDRVVPSAKNQVGNGP